MSRPAPLVQIPVGVVLERRKAKSPWVDYIWRPVAALPGIPEAKPWTELARDAETTRFYVGGFAVGLYRADAPRYRENLTSGAPALWVVARPTGVEPPYEIVMVTANPSEGEAFTAAGSDLVEPVEMPQPVREIIEAFVVAHDFEEPFVKRKRRRADPEALARRSPLAKERKT